MGTHSTTPTASPTSEQRLTPPYKSHQQTDQPRERAYLTCKTIGADTVDSCTAQITVTASASSYSAVASTAGCTNAHVRAEAAHRIAATALPTIGRVDVVLYEDEMSMLRRVANASIDRPQLPI